MVFVPSEDRPRNDVGTELTSQQWYPLEQVVGLLYEARIGAEDNHRTNSISELRASLLAGTATLHDLGEAHCSKRLDTYIYNQGESLYRGLTELITNGIDASERIVGRFGVGFFQSLAFLKDPGDLLTVRSKTTQDDPMVLQFRKSGSSIELSFPRPESLDVGDFPVGTQITLTKAKSDPDFARQLESYTRSNVERCNLARISINSKRCNDLAGYRLIGDPPRVINTPDVEVQISQQGFTVTDFGRGMNRTDVGEKLLIPKFNDETASHREFDPSRTYALTKARGDYHAVASCDVRIQVCGILVETLKVTGSHLPESFIIELPPGTWLPESRNQVQLNHQLSSALLALAQKATNEVSQPEIFALLNAIAGTIAELETRPGQDKACSVALRRLVSEILERSNICAIPNTQEFTCIDLGARDDVVSLHPSLVSLACEGLGFTRPTNFRSSTHTLWLADFAKGGNTSFLTHGELIIFDRALYNKFRDVPGVLNESLDPYIGYGERETPKGKFVSPKQASSTVGSDVDALDLSRLPRSIAAGLSTIIKLRERKKLERIRQYDTDALKRREIFVAGTANIGKQTVDRLANVATLFPGDQIHPEALLFEVQLGLWPTIPPLKALGSSRGEVRLSGGIEREEMLSAPRSDSMPRLSTPWFTEPRVSTYFYWLYQLSHIGVSAKVSPTDTDEFDPKVGDASAANGWFFHDEPSSRSLASDHTERASSPSDPSPLTSDSSPIGVELSFLDLRKDGMPVFWDDAGKRLLVKKPESPITLNPAPLTPSEIKAHFDSFENEDSHEVSRYGRIGLLPAAAETLIKVPRSDAGISVLRFRDTHLSNVPFIGVGKGRPLTMSRLSGSTGVADLFEIWAPSSQKIVELTPEGLVARMDCPPKSRLMMILNNGDSLLAVQDAMGDNSVYLYHQGEFISIEELKGVDCGFPPSICGIDFIKVRGRHLLFNGDSLVDLNTLLGLPTDVAFKEAHGGFTLGEVGSSSHYHELRLREGAFGSNKGVAFDEPLLNTTRSLLKKYTDVIGDAPVAKQKIFSNLWLCEPASSEDLEHIFPWLAHLEPAAVEAIPTGIQDAIAPLATRDPAAFKSYCDLFAEAYSRFGSTGRYSNVIERWCRLMDSQPVLAQKIRGLLDRDFGSAENPQRGWDFFWPVKCKEAPPELRPYLEYLFGDYRYPMRELSQPYAVNVDGPVSHSQSTSLAQLVDTVRRVSRYGEINSLQEIESPADPLPTAGLHLIERELCKTATSQDRSSMMWIRELVQNARDALRRVATEDPTTIKPSIEIDSFYDGKHFGTTVRDPVGMSLHELVYYLLSPDNSSKTGTSALAGFFGQGFYTTFLGASQVVVKTSLGDGRIFEIVLGCEHDAQGGLSKISILSLDETNGEFKGTEITRLERCDHFGASLRHALVSDAAYRFVSTIDAREISIALNEQSINQPSKLLSELSAEAGRVRVLTLHDGFSRVTIDNLYLMAMNDKFGVHIPEILRPTLERVGFVVDLPSTIRPTRTRIALSQEDQILDQLQRVTAVGALVSSVKLFLEEDFDIPGIPRDYLYTYAKSTVHDPSIIKDAVVINTYLLDPPAHVGTLSSIDFDAYTAKKNGHRLAQLLTLIRTPLAYDGQTISMSLSELRDSIEAQARKAQAPPSDTGNAHRVSDVNKLRLGTHMTTQVDSAIGIVASSALDTFSSPRVQFSGTPQASAEIKAQELSRDESFLLSLVARYIQCIDPSVTLKYVRGGRRVADYDRFDNSVTVNLSDESVQRKLVEPLKRMKEGSVSPADFDSFTAYFVNVFTHEMTHASDTGWTHQNDTRFSESFRYRYELLLRETLLDEALEASFFELNI
jgi:hypothetical protein